LWLRDIKGPIWIFFGGPQQLFTRLWVRSSNPPMTQQRQIKFVLGLETVAIIRTSMETTEEYWRSNLTWKRL